MFLPTKSLLDVSRFLPFDLGQRISGDVHEAFGDLFAIVGRSAARADVGVATGQAIPLVSLYKPLLQRLPLTCQTLRRPTISCTLQPMTEHTKPTLYLTGPRVGGPTPQDIFALYAKLTGKEPTPEERARIEARYAKLKADRT